MGKESSLVWGPLRRTVKGVWRRIEDRANRGTPDLHFVTQGRQGVMELKYVDKWPARPDTKTTLGLSSAQAQYARTWAVNGGTSFVLARIGGVGGGWLLVPGEHIGQAQGLPAHHANPNHLFKDTQAGWIERACYFGTELNWDWLWRAIQNHPAGFNAWINPEVVVKCCHES